MTMRKQSIVIERCGYRHKRSTYNAFVVFSSLEISKTAVYLHVYRCWPNFL